MTKEHKEIVVVMTVQLSCIPHFSAELCLNYDGDLHSSNLLGGLSKNGFPIAGLDSILFSRSLTKPVPSG